MTKASGILLFYVAGVCLFSTAQGHGRKGFLGFFGINFNNGGPNQKSIENEIMQTLTDAKNDKLPTETLIQVLTVMNSTQKDLKKLTFINLGQFNIVLKQLKGNAQEVAEARQTIKKVVAAAPLDQIMRMYWKPIKRIFDLYKNYLNKESAKKAIREDSTENLMKGLNTLAIVERFFRFRGIVFGDLAENLQKNGEQGRKEVVDKLSKWIDTADIHSFKKASLVYTMATQAKSSSSTTTPPSGQPTSPGFSTPATQRPNAQPLSTFSTAPPGGQSTVLPSTTPQRRPE